jgi:purine-nucleoside phosphorylase
MWCERGCKAVNMDTSYFYAVSVVVGISAVYACVISDCVEGPIWEDGFIRARQSIGLLQDLIIASAGKMLNTDSPCRNP